MPGRDRVATSSVTMPSTPRRTSSLARAGRFTVHVRTTSAIARSGPTVSGRSRRSWIETPSTARRRSARGSGKARSPCRWSGAVVPEALRRARGGATRGADGEPARAEEGADRLERLLGDLRPRPFTSSTSSVRARSRRAARRAAACARVRPAASVPEDRQRPDGPQVPDLEPPPVEADVRFDELGAEELGRTQVREAVARAMRDEERPGAALGSPGRLLAGHVRRVAPGSNVDRAEARKGPGRASAASGPGPSPPLRGGCVPPSQGGSHDA